MVELWHPESPGVRIIVRRSFLGRMFGSRHFATLSECLAAGKFNTFANTHVRERMNNKYFKKGFSLASELLYGRCIPPLVVREKFLEDEIGSKSKEFSLYLRDGVEAALNLYESLELSPAKVAAHHQKHGINK